MRISTCLALALASAALADDPPPGDRARRARCRNEIRSLVAALVAYRDDWGAYPPDGGVDGSTTALLTHLCGDGVRRSGYAWLSAERIRSWEYLDDWGNPYRYDELASEGREVPGSHSARPPAKVSTGSFDLWSTAGSPDSKTGAEWITNYRERDRVPPRTRDQIVADLVPLLEELGVFVSVSPPRCGRSSADAWRSRASRSSSP